MLLPILVLLVAGVADLGRGIQSYVAITNAAQVGARFGATSSSDTSGIQTHVQTALTSTNISVTYSSTCSGTNVICVSYPSGNASGNPIKVSIQWQYSSIVGTVLTTSPITIQSAAQDQIQ